MQTVEIRGTHPIIRSKVFCSQPCRETYEKQNLLSCQLLVDELDEEGRCCSNRFLKTGGSLLFGKWFCSEQCAEKDNETKEKKAKAALKQKRVEALVQRMKLLEVESEEDDIVIDL